MILVLCVASAFGAEPAYFHPDKVAGASSLFGEIADGLGPSFERAQVDLAAVSTSVDALERAALLMGDRAPSGVADYAEATRRQMVHQYLQLQAHVSLIEDDTSETFMGALERAMGAVGDYAYVECNSGTSLASLIGPGSGRQGATRCEGADLNDALAQAMDADPGLRDAVSEILSLEWPSMTIAGAEQPALELAGADGYVQLHRLADALVASQLDALNVDLDRSLAGIDLEDPAQLPEAEAVRAEYEAAMAALGAQLLDAAGWYLDKKGPGVGVCANPEALGGCPGSDRTDEVLGPMSEHKKVQKLLK